MKKKILTIVALVFSLVCVLSSCDEDEHTHEFGQWSIAQNATCTINGTEERTCSCGEKETKPINALGHTEVIDAAVAPTCTETGLTEGKHCSVCSEALTAQEIVPASHDWETTYEYDKGVHWKNCKQCDATTTRVAHDLGKDGYCKTCDNPIAESDGVLYFQSADGTYAEVIDYVGDSTRVVVAEEYEGVPVTHISKDAFKSKAITAIVLPNSVTSIGSSAFEDCSSLTSIVIPDGVTSIGHSAFYECSSLMSITIPDSVTSIGGDAFDQCVGITETVDGVTYVDDCVVDIDESRAFVAVREGTVLIGNVAFAGCSKLRAVTLPSTVKHIGASAFSGCSSLTSITIPDSVMSIGEYAFYDCSALTSIVIPEGVTSIGERAFSGCRSLTSIVIPEGVTSIGSRAFIGCSSLTSIVIPDSVTSIGSESFHACSDLTAVYYSGTDWNKISIASYNSNLLYTPRYYYSETQPTDTAGAYWHYVDGVPTEW